MGQQPAARPSFLWLPQVMVLNVVFWTIAPLATLVFALGAAPFILAYHLVFRDPRRTIRLYRRTINHYGKVALRCAWPMVKVRYVDMTPGLKPPFVLVANHKSSSDGFLLAFLDEEVVQVINLWPARVPILGLLARLAGYIRIREMSFAAFLEAGSRLLGQGASIIAFPEGTRSGAGQMGNFHGAAFRLAQQCGVPVVPVAISGNEQIPTRGTFILHPGTIVVTRLPAISAEECRALSPFQLKTRVRDMIQRHLDQTQA